LFGQTISQFQERSSPEHDRTKQQGGKPLRWLATLREGLAASFSGSSFVV
jgi:hypothetical protein